MVPAPPPVRFAGIVAVTQVGQQQSLADGFRRRAGRSAAGRQGGQVAPAPQQAHRQRHRGIRPHRAEQGDHRVVRHDPVEAAGRVGVLRKEDLGTREQAQHHGEEQRRRGRAEQQREAAPREQGARPRRPGVAPVGRPADGGQRARHVDPERVRRRILAGVQARAAVVAQVRQVAEVGLREVEAALDGRKDGAEAFAVAAGVADARRVPPRLEEPRRQRRPGLRPGVSCGHAGPPPPRPCGRTPCRWPCRVRPGSPGPGCCRP